MSETQNQKRGIPGVRALVDRIGRLGSLPIRLASAFGWSPSTIVSLLLAFLGFLSVSAATRYVDLNWAAPASPYTNWTTAATNIQDAADVAVADDLILVTNGVYQTGAQAVYGMSNRVAVTKAVTVQSGNGPEVTIIKGYQVPGTTNGDAAVRCVYLTNGAVLTGFTLTNGATQSSGDSSKQLSGGGVWAESLNVVVTNCVLTGNSAVYGGGACYATLTNCTLTGNSAGQGGGTYFSSLNHCTLMGNSAYDSGGGAHSSTLINCTLAGNSAFGPDGRGGGAYYSTLDNCTLTGNSAPGRYGYSFSGYGGGACGGTLNNCTLTGNSAQYGGGASDDTYEFATLTNCTLTGNSASFGGGAYSSALYNCALTGNSASEPYGYGGGASYSALENCLVTGNSALDGGGASFSTLNNCTVTGNSASYGGGARYSTLNNCILYYNIAPSAPNYYNGTYNFCCTTPLPPGGIGNLADDPQFASLFHLSFTSPCRGAGSPAYAHSRQPKCYGADA